MRAALGLGLIRATSLIDKAYYVFDRLRSRAVLGLASDAVLDAYNDAVYGAHGLEWLPHQPQLFSWEELALSRFFPQPPARLLIGGAGAGREAFALSERGYRVVAFEPSSALVDTMNGHAQAAGIATVDVYRARYADLPHLLPLDADKAARSLLGLTPFDASILGWSSFSHIRTEEERIRTLKIFGELTGGPILVSYYQRPDPVEGSSKASWLRRVLLGGEAGGRSEGFGLGVGYYHYVSNNELAATAAHAGLEIAFLNSQENWPHAILMRSSRRIVAGSVPETSIVSA